MNVSGNDNRKLPMSLLFLISFKHGVILMTTRNKSTSRCSATIMWMLHDLSIAKHHQLTTCLVVTKKDKLNVSRSRKSRNRNENTMKCINSLDGTCLEK